MKKCVDNQCIGRPLVTTKRSLFLEKYTSVYNFCKCHLNYLLPWQSHSTSDRKVRQIGCVLRKGDLAIFSGCLFTILVILLNI